MQHAPTKRLTTVLLLLVVSLGAALPASASAADPVLALGFDDGSGSVARDSSEFGNDGEINGADWSTAGKHGGALSFDDANEDWVTVADDDSLDVGEELTISAWVRPDEARAWQMLLTKESTNWFSYALYAEGAQSPEAYVSEAEPGYASTWAPSALPVDEWSHVAMTSDGTTLRLYVDGSQVASAQSDPAQDTAGALRIGGNSMWGEYFDGLIDDVRVYDQALTATEIETDKTTAVPEPPGPPELPGPVLALGFDDGSGSVARDSSEHGNDGDVNGADWSTNGKYGGALSFDDANEDWVTVADDDSLDVGEELTVSAWVRPDEARAWQMLLVKESASWFSYALYSEGAQSPETYISEAEPGYSSTWAPSALPVDEWSHVAVTSDGTTLRLYVDGSEVANAQSDPAQDTAGALRIGGNSMWGEYFDGLIDDVRVYDQALTAAQIETAKTTPVDEPPEQIEPGPVRYSYDAAGRLASVTERSQGGARYRWDTVGNLLEVSRWSPSQLAVAGFNPARGPVGSEVTLTGTGFAPSATENTVKFGSVEADVTAAERDSLTVEVPAGAETDTVSVETGGQTATTSDPFTVTEPREPRIDGIDPSIAKPGDAVTVDGAHFDSVLSGNTVGVNRTLAPVTDAEDDELQIEVPEAAGSGRVDVTTAEGKAVGPDLFIPPDGYSVADIGQTGRMEYRDPKAISVDAAHKAALIVFDGEAKQLVSMRATAVSGDSDVTIRGPEGLTLATWAIRANADYMPAIRLPKEGTYTLVVDPVGDQAASTTITAYEFGPSEVVDPTSAGTARDIEVNGMGLRGELRFRARQGQRVMVGMSESTFNWADISLRRPDGSNIGNPVGAGTWLTGYTSGVLGPTVIPADGVYSISIEPRSRYNGQDYDSGSIKLKVYDVPESLTGTIDPSPAGGSETLDFESPGQVGELTFEGQAGEYISLKAPDVSAKSLVMIRDPGGEDVGGMWADKDGDYGEAVKLPEDGTYTMLVDPRDTQTGELTVTAYSYDSGAALTPTPSGVTKEVTLNGRGMNGEVRFHGQAGQRIHVSQSQASIYRGTYSLRRPNGHLIGYSHLFGSWFSDGGTKTLEPAVLPEDGIYTVFVNPENQLSFPDGEFYDSGSVTIKINEIAQDLTGTIDPSASGDTETLDFATSGQLGQLTFEGEEGEFVSLKASGVVAKSDVTIRRPNGTVIGGAGIRKNGDYSEAVELPQDGEYTIVVDPIDAETGAISLTAYSSDPGEPITPTTAGAAKTLDINGRGLNGAIRFTGENGQEISVDLSGISIHRGRWEIRRPDGTRVGSDHGFGTYYGTGGGDVSVGGVELPVDGTYTLFFNPETNYWPNWETYYDDGSVTATVTLGETQPASFRSVTSPRFVFAAHTPSAGGRATTPVALLSGTDPRFVEITDDSGRAKRIARRSSTRKGVRRYKGARFGPRPLAANPIRVRRARRGTKRRGAKAATRRKRRQGAPRRGAGSRRPLRGQTLRATPQKLHRTTTARKLGFKPRESAAWRPGKRSRKDGWFAKRPESPFSRLPALRAPRGTTALAGQTLKLDGAPLAGVRISVSGSSRSVRTDRSGRFLLTGLRAGHRVLTVDGRRVSKRGQRFGAHQVGVDLGKGKTTVMDSTIWMSVLDRAGDIRLPKRLRRPMTLTNPAMPGFEVRLPAGSVVRDKRGRQVRTLNLTPVPLDRPPFPLPHFQVPVYFTLQPGGVSLSKGAQVVYPNYMQLAPGQRVDFWNYDPKRRGWFVYGKGTVTEDGKQMVPDKGVRIWDFTGAMASSGPSPPESGPRNENGEQCCDPVDLSTGLQIYKKTDLVVEDSIPAAVQRIYRPEDSNSYSFGRGTSGVYDLWLWGVGLNQDQIDLVQPHGGRVRFRRINPGSSTLDAEYLADWAPGKYFGARIRSNSISGFDVFLSDGSVLTFGRFGPIQGVTDRHGRKLTITRANGNTGRVTQVTTEHGRWIKFGYDTSSRITEATDNGGRATSYTYNPDGLLATATNAAGATTEYTYNAAGRMTEVKDNRDITFLKNIYDGKALVRQEQADGSSYEFDWDWDEIPCPTSTLSQGNGGSSPAGGGGSGTAIGYRGPSSGGGVVAPPPGLPTQPVGVVHCGDEVVGAVTVTHPGGDKRRVEFDDLGFSTSDTADYEGDLERKLTYERDPHTKFLIKVTDEATDREAELGYDGAGRLTNQTVAAGTPLAATTLWSYTPFGDAKSVTDPENRVTQMAYDPEGRLRGQTDPSGRETRVEYEGQSPEPSAIIDPAGKRTELGFARGNLLSIRDPLGRETRAGYDAVGRQVSVTDPQGAKATVTYDPNNQVTKVAGPGGTTSAEYDPNGNLKKLTDPANHSTTTTYDVMDRPETVTDPLGRATQLEHDANGNLIGVRNRRGQLTRYRYDALDRPVFAGFDATGPAESESYDSSIEVGWDDADNPTSVTDSAGGTFTQTFDTLNRLTGQSGPRGAVGYSYDLAGRRLTMTATGQPQTNYGYDAAGRLTGVARGTDSVALVYDQVGRQSSQTLPNGIVQDYSYDDASQLTGIGYSRGAQQLGELNYGYDSAGRRRVVSGSYARTGLPAAMTATYDAANQRTSENGQSISHDADGNMTAAGGSTFSWDARGQLASMGGLDGPASFEYDPFGRRSALTRGSDTKHYLHDGDNVLQEQTSSGTATLLTGLELDQVFGRRTTGENVSMLTDGLGSVIGLSDGLGSLNTEYTYDPFGNATLTGAASDNPWQYTARESDGTGLQYNRARYYRPAAARFASEDPMGFAGGDTNLYGYVLNDPVNLVDPTGRTWSNPLDKAEHVASDARDTVREAAQKGFGYAKNFGPNDLGHAALGAFEVADGVVVMGIGAMGAVPCYTGASAGGPIGWAAGYPACTAFTVGTFGAGAWSITNGVKQFGKVDLTDCEGFDDFFR